MLVVSDINDMFMPINEGFLVDPHESRCGCALLPSSGCSLTAFFGSQLGHRGLARLTAQPNG